MAERSTECTRLLVAAMDFGTTYSGYAFSFRSKPDEVRTNPNWVAGSEKLMSIKCPTAVLLRPNKEFHSFGFEAENKYAELAEDGEHHGWYLFRRFKMILYETKNLKMDTPMEDMLGRKMPAIDIFSHAIRFLKRHFLQTIQTRTVGVLESDVQYIITVPAIWDEKAKQFMRRAAIKADIPNEQISLALEPEAAAIWCQHATGDNMDSLKKIDSKCMVVDLGGGTADITVHQNMEDGSLKELHRATGGAWGGNEVDKAYLNMLSDIIGPKNMEKFKQEEVSYYFDILRDFEIQKRTITDDSEGYIRFKIPAVLREAAESDGVKLQDKIAKSRFTEKVTLVRDKFKVDKKVVKGYFDNPLRMLISHITSSFSESGNAGVDAILLVGGFAECELVKKAFQNAFPHKRVMIPLDAGSAVLKGAVRFGHHQEIISHRIARFTIGREAWEDFKSHHDPSRKIIRNGNELCRNIFIKIIEIDTEIPRDKVFEETFSAFAHQKSCNLRLFSSTKHNVKYTTEPECMKLGTLYFKLPESSEKSDKRVFVRYCFGETEIYIRVKILKTGEEYETWIDCL